MARVLLIGATSAIASEVARIYGQRGDSLYLLARDPVALTSLSQELELRVVGSESGDFNDTVENEGRIERARLTLGGIDVVLLAHGWLGDQRRSELEFDHARQVLDTNFTSALSLLVPLANALERQGSGRIVVLSTVAADRGRPRNYTYAAAKAALDVYLQGLRSRLWGSGVEVLVVKLGPVDTPMTADHAKNPLFATAAGAAHAIVRAADRGRSTVYVPGYWRPIMFVVRWLPEALFQRFSFLAGR